jgi:hypothetical protein
MTDQDLRALLRDHITETEPPFTLQPTAALTRGHHLRSRRVVRVSLVSVVAVAALGVGFVTLPHPWSASDDGFDGIAPASQRALEEYDASAMPALMDDRIRAAVEDRRVLGEPEFTAADDQEVALPDAEWDQAHSMTMRYGGDSEHRLRVRLGHGRGYAEGSACQEPTGTPTSFEYTCGATTLADGTVVEMTVGAVYPDPMGELNWMALTPRMLEAGKLPRWTVRMGADSRVIDPAKVFFIRVAKAVHSETFVTTVQEAVQATSYDEAMREFALSTDVLTEIATDPVLVIPEPPKQPAMQQGRAAVP